jgi:hypothetical protein
MQIIFGNAASDAAPNDSHARPGSWAAEAATDAKSGRAWTAGWSGVRPDALLGVRLEPDTGTGTPDSGSCTSAAMGVHGSGSRRNPLWGSRAGVYRHGRGSHD